MKYLLHNSVLTDKTYAICSLNVLEENDVSTPEAYCVLMELTLDKPFAAPYFKGTDPIGFWGDYTFETAEDAIADWLAKQPTSVEDSPLSKHEMLLALIEHCVATPARRLVEALEEPQGRAAAALLSLLPVRPNPWPDKDTPEAVAFNETEFFIGSVVAGKTRCYKFGQSAALYNGLVVLAHALNNNSNNTYDNYK